MLKISECFDAIKEINDGNVFFDRLHTYTTGQVQDDLFFISFEGLFAKANQTEKTRKLLEKYYVYGEFSLGRIFVNSEFHFSLFCASTNKPDFYKTSVYNELPYIMTAMVGLGRQFIMPKHYSEGFYKYLSEIEKWVNEDIKPNTDKEKYEFSVVDYSDKLTFENPRRYTESYRTIEKTLKTEKIIKMRDVASVIEPSYDGFGDQGVLITIDEQKPYLYNSERYINGIVSDTKIEIGDIIYPRNQADAKPYLITEYNMPNVDLYADPSIYVIRSRRIQPEYLWLYLASEVAFDVVTIMNSEKVIKISNADELMDIPIIQPSLNEEYYRSVCESFLHQGKRVYGVLSGNTFETTYMKKSEKPSDILNWEIVRNIASYQESELNGLLSNDLYELNICYANRAYKATLILAGSILEAILIDWLSEIKGVNYYENDYIVPGTGRRADLIDYINEIKELKKPMWVNEAAKAHKIRKKRNLVHAKLCLNTDEINDEICREVVQYLKEVLQTRGVKTS